MAKCKALTGSAVKGLNVTCNARNRKYLTKFNNVNFAAASIAIIMLMLVKHISQVSKSCNKKSYDSVVFS